MELLEEMVSVGEMPALASVGYAPVLNHRDSERLNRAIQFINKHLSGALQLSDVANEAGMSTQAGARIGGRGIMFIAKIRRARKRKPAGRVAGGLKRHSAGWARATGSVLRSRPGTSTAQTNISAEITTTTPEPSRTQ